MREKDRILVLRRIAHKDQTYVIDALSREQGRRTFLLKTAQTQAGKRNRSLSVPMQFLEVEWTGRSTKWPRIVRLNPLIRYQELFFDFRKSAMGYFIIENIRQLTHGNEDPSLYDWLRQTFETLDKTPFRPGFHLSFMADLIHQLGIAPLDEEFGTFFDMKNGVFRNQSEMHTWSARRSFLFRKLLAKEPFAGPGERDEALQAAEQYLSYHFPAYKLPKSLRIYKEIFE